MRAALDVTLAEFNALRSEIVARVSGQTASVGIGVTALGAFFTFGSSTAATFIPVAAMCMSLLTAVNWYWIQFIGMYIRKHVWPRLQQLGEQTESPGWERFSASLAFKPKFLPFGAMFDYAAPATFLTFAVLSIIQTPPTNVALWVLDILCVILIPAAPVWMAVTFHLEAEKELPSHPLEARRPRPVNRQT
ncbi:hypothetical protein [Promicromonospora sp. NPDC057488]|uniref:hypothetical protein n=1 Tax=Promicromonospora sp. NPDC057488 TaxID=3346147 RepID=UPI00366E3D73